MSEVTINIPAERVELVRDHFQRHLTYIGDSLSEADGQGEKLRRLFEHMGRLAHVLDVLGWEGDAAACTLTADQYVLGEILGEALEYAQEDMGGAKRDELPDLMARIEWLSDTLDSLELEAVPA